MFRGWDSDRKLFVLLLVAAGGCLAFNYPDVLAAKTAYVARLAQGALAELRAKLPSESLTPRSILSRLDLAQPAAPQPINRRTANRRLTNTRPASLWPTFGSSGNVRRAVPVSNGAACDNAWQASNCQQVNVPVWERVIDCQGRVLLVRRCRPVGPYCR